MIKIDMPFDKIEFDGGMRQAICGTEGLGILRRSKVSRYSVCNWLFVATQINRNLEV